MMLLRPLTRATWAEARTEVPSIMDSQAINSPAGPPAELRTALDAPATRQELLRAISESSAKLNERADRATRALERLEKRLSEAEIGISVGHGPIFREPLAASEARAETRMEAGTETGEEAFREVHLGYGKVKSKWGITVHECTVARPSSANGAGQSRVLNRGETLLLRKAERELRMAAEPHLDGLVQSIAEALDARLARLDAISNPSGAVLEDNSLRPQAQAECGQAPPPGEGA